MGFGEGNIAAQENALCRELESQGVLKGYVIGKKLTQHTSSPGQGWAICAGMAISTLV